MFTRISQWFKAPFFEHDEEKTRLAGMLNAILVVAFFISLIINVGIWSVIPNAEAALVASGALMVGLASMSVMLRRGWVRSTGILLIAVLSGFYLITTVFFGGILNVTFNSFVTVIIVAGLLFGGSASLGVAVLGSVVGLLVLFAQMNNALPPAAIPITPIVNWVGNAGIFLATALLVNLATSGITQALKRARNNERTLAERNRDLQISQSALEARMRELERRSLQVQVAAEVGHVAATYQNLNDLFNQVTRLISQRFNAYHTGIFLMDDSGEYAILQATNSSGGQKLMAQGYRLQVGEKSVVGNAIARRDAYLIQNVEKDNLYTSNPNLSETRSEIVVPLIVSERLLGALDIHSAQEAAFTLEDMSIIKLLGDQVAIVISNARLTRQVQESQEIERRAYSQTARSAWLTLIQARSSSGYLCNAQGVVLPSTHPRPELMEASRQGHTVQPSEDTIAIPVKVRDQSVAAIRFRKPSEAGQWTPEEMHLLESLSDQLGQALESARLYQDTQLQAERERLIGEITAKMRESLDIESVLQASATEMRMALGLDELVIRLTQPQQDNQVSGVSEE